MTKSNAVTFTVADVEGGESSAAVEIQRSGTLILDDDATSAVLTANADVTWSAADFLTGNATDVVTVAADGTVTAVRNGIAWVKATADGAEDKIPVVVSLSRMPGLASGFSITREDTANYSMTDTSVTITQQGGNDLWQWDNNLENLFLYSDFDRTDLRTVVKIDGLPVRAANNWDTASFLLYAGDDDYVSIGKKGHKNGIATVVELAQACTEYEESSTDNNNLTSAYFGFTVENGTISMDYKIGDGRWTTANSVQVPAEAVQRLSDYQIGFGAWGTGGNDITFSAFKVGKASEVSYDDLMAQDEILIGVVENQAPAVSNVTFDADGYSIGSKASVAYTFSDADGDAEGASLYLWTYEENGIVHTAVTDVPEFTVMAAGELTCAVYPVDAQGTPGIPAEVSVSTSTGNANLSLRNLAINGAEFALDGGETEFEVLIPADMAKVELSYQALMTDVGATAVAVGSQEAQSRNNTDRFGLDITGQDTVTITRSAADGEDKVYTVTLVRIESNATEIQGIEIPELSFAVTDLSVGYWGTRTIDASATLKVLADDTIGSVEVRYNNYRQPITMTKTAAGYEGDISFVTGLNSYYVTVVAKDGITREQYNVNVVYTPDTASALQDLKINGTSVENFASDTYEYLVALDQTDSLTVEAVSDQKVRIRIGNEYFMEDAGKNSLTISDLEGGTYEAYIVTVADDGIVKTAYRVDLVVPYEENVELFAFTVNGTDIREAVDENGAATISINGTTANVEITAMDAGASIAAVSGSDETTGTGSVSHTVALVDGTATLNVTVTARDGVTTKTYTITVNKVFDPSDDSRDIPVSVLTATTGDYEPDGGASEGPAHLVLDSNAGTIWHTDWYGTSRANHWIQFELSEDYIVDGLRYQPRQSGSTNGTILAYEIQTSDDGVNFETVATGNWENNTSWKGAEFTGIKAKYVRLVALNAVTDNSYVFASAAEIRLTGEKTNSETPHEHIFDQENTDAKYLVSEADCKNPAIYKYSCVCGEEGSETFSHGAELGHDYVNGVCSRCGEADPDYVAPVVDADVTRLSGSGRCETAYLAANELKTALGVEKFDAVIIASGDNFADALAGSYLAAVKGAPILLYRNGYADDNAQYIAANLKDGGTVYILGGTAAVPEEMETVLAGYAVKRVKGANRFETNLAILEEAGVGDKDILVATGYNFADSLSASATGMPILLVHNSNTDLTESQKEFLDELDGNNIVVIGGTGAVNEALYTALSAYDAQITRVKGSGREATSVAIAEKYFDAPEAALVAYSRNFPDGLCGGPLAYALGAPLLLTNTGYEDITAAYTAEMDIVDGFVLGGTAAVSDEIVRTVFAMEADAEITVKR